MITIKACFESSMVSNPMLFNLSPHTPFQSGLIRVFIFQRLSSTLLLTLPFLFISILTTFPLHVSMFGFHRHSNRPNVSCFFFFGFCIASLSSFCSGASASLISGCGSGASLSSFNIFNVPFSFILSSEVPLKVPY